MRSPVQIDTFIRDNAHKMDLPVQFFGDEPNAYLKDWDSASVRWLICASWPYEAAAGNQSIPSVYKAINIGNVEPGVRPMRDDFLADRFYLPSTPHDLRMFEKAGYPIFGIESKHPMLDFDVVATSIAYPVLMISFYKYLMMSGIPLRWKDRAENAGDWPFIMIGGQAYGAPEGLAPVADCIWCGEVEDEPNNPGIAAVTERIDDFKKDGTWSSERIECYKQLAREFNFLYFPMFIDIHYGYEDRSHVNVGPELSKQVMGYSANIEGMKLPVLKRIVKDMNAVVPLDNPPLLFADPGMGAGDLEVGRGCPAWCSFCALTYRQKPYRQRDVSFMTEFAGNFTRNVGGTNLVPFMPDFPMHTQRKKLISSLLENVSDEVDSPAMRVDDFIADKDYILLQVHGGMDGVTLGVEGNSQRMRDLVGKGCADEDIKEAVTRGIRAGIRKFKLFMISNLPGEDEGDVFRILKLAKEMADIRDSMNQPNVRIQLSWTPLLIEANTPFQWFAPPTSTRALGDVWEEFRDIKIDFKLGGKAEVNKASFFQLCQRASRDVGEAIVDVCEAINAPGRGGCWGGVPKAIPAWPGKLGAKDALEQALKNHGFKNGYDDVWDERFKQDMFGWEFIDQGVNPELLWITYLQMREFVEQTDSHTYDLNFGDEYHGNEWIERCDTKCYGRTCGTCDVEDLQIRRTYIQQASQEEHIDLSKVKAVDQKSIAMKVRAKLVKTDDKRFVQNDHWRFHLRRAAYQAQHELGSEFGISKRTIRFASDSVRYKDWTSGLDYVEFGITRRATPVAIREFLECMNRHMLGMQILTDETSGDWNTLPSTAPHMRTDIDLNLFDLELDVDPHTALDKLKRWHSSSYVKMILKQEGGYFAPEREEFNAKDFCDDLWLIRDGNRLVLRMLLRGRPSPYNIYAALMDRSSWTAAAEKPAVRLESFIDMNTDLYDFFRPVCEGCDRTILMNPLEQPYDSTYCPRCRSEAEGELVTLEALAATV